MVLRLAGFEVGSDLCIISGSVAGPSDHGHRLRSSPVTNSQSLTSQRVDGAFLELAP